MARRGTSLGKSVLQLDIDDSRFTTGLKQGEKQADSWTTRVGNKLKGIASKLPGGDMIAKGLGLGAGVSVFNMASDAIGRLTSFVGDSVKAGSDLAESQNAVNVVFGEAADKIDAYGTKAAAAAGLSQRAFNELVTPIGAMLQNLGYSQDQAADSSINLAQRAADMASVFNVDVSEALQAIQAGLRGEADPLERFGVGLSDAAVTAKALEMGLAGTASELTANAKTQARLALLMEQTDKVAGDFANTSGEQANQTRINDAAMENLQARIGKGLLPVWQAVGAVMGKVVLPAADAVVTAFGASVKVIDFLKPGLIALATVALVVVVPSLVAMAVAAGTAAVAMVVAFAPVLVPLAAIGAAVAGISLAANHFAMDFGDMGTKIHELSDKMGVDYTVLKDRIRAEMEATGKSFEEVTAKMELDAKVAAHGITDAMSEGVRHAGGALREGGPVVAAEAGKIAGMLPEELRAKIEDIKQVGRDSVLALATAILERQQDPLLAIDALNKVMEESLSDAELIAKLAGEDTMKSLRAGLGSSIAADRVAAGEALHPILDTLNSLGPAGKEAAEALMRELGLGITNNAYTATEAMRRAVGGIRANLPFSEPEDPKSPLRGLGKSGEAIVDTLAEGLGDTRSIDGAIRGLAQHVRSGLLEDMPAIAMPSLPAAAAVTHSLDGSGFDAESVTGSVTHVHNYDMLMPPQSPAELDRMMQLVGPFAERYFEANRRFERRPRN